MVTSTGAGRAEQFGVYVHVPFCTTRCDYCAFATWTDRHHLQNDYLAACRTEIERMVAGGMPPATSIFVGGGTPSLLPAADLVDVLDRIPRSANCELTVEANPDTVTPELVDVFAAGGVTRLSLGVQSMVPEVLRSLGRSHDPANVRRAVELLRGAGIPTFNLDLIYGGAGESLEDWRRTLDAVLELEPPHVSAYALTVEPGTPLAVDVDRHPDDDDQADKYLAACAALEAAGLRWYEISNWARPGHECRHNGLYWSMGEYQAIGCAGHSHRGGRRFWNVRTPERYIEAITSEQSPVAGDERLDPESRRLEALQLALRTRVGVPAGVLPVDELPGLVERVDAEERLVLTVEGRLLANEVALRLR
jgi:putative oxygen-independent coproporphyrinogen III oxidase